MTFLFSSAILGDRRLDGGLRYGSHGGDWIGGIKKWVKKWDLFSAIIEIMGKETLLRKEKSGPNL
jgi:hypothetical protein